MRTLALTVLLSFALPFGGASAFQVIAPEQMDESGLNLSERGYFSQYGADVNPEGPQVQFYSNGRRIDSTNFYGRRDGGGRFFGDRRDSNFQGCASGFSNAGQLDAMSGTGFAYPCQRFR